MAASNLPYLKTNPSVIFFTDFDGTITLEDSKGFRSSPIAKYDFEIGD